MPAKDKTTVHGTVLPGRAPAIPNRLGRLAAWCRANPGTVLMYPPDVAWVLDVEPSSVHKYTWTANRNRTRGHDGRPPGPGARDIPVPVDSRPGRHGPPAPVWTPEQIRDWIPVRFEAGKPRKDGTSPAPSPDRKPKSKGPVKTRAA
jgi:hypothetical protein